MTKTHFASTRLRCSSSRGLSSKASLSAHWWQGGHGGVCAHKELPMYEHLERLFQGLAPTSEYLKSVYYELAAEFFKQLRQQIEVTQNELRESEQLEIYYHVQGEEPMLVSKIGCLAPGLLVLYGT